MNKEETTYKAELKFKTGLMMTIVGEAEILDKKMLFLDNPFLNSSIEELKNFFVGAEINEKKIVGIEYHTKASPPYRLLGLIINK